MNSFLQQTVELLQSRKIDFAGCFRVAIEMIRYFADASSCSLREYAAKESLEEMGLEAERESSAADVLSRALFEACREFSEMISQQLQMFTEQGRLCLDELFSQYISHIGIRGKQLSEELSRASLNWRKSYSSDGDVLVLFRLWLDCERPPYYCRYLNLLGEILWKDRVKAQFERHQHYVPALTQGIQRTLCRLLSPRAQVLLDDQRVSFVVEGTIIATSKAVDPSLIPLVARGLKNFASLYHHRLLRFECREGFAQWIEEKRDVGVLKFEGGETELARRLGFSCKEAPSILKALLHAQAYMQCSFEDGSEGSLISLKQFRSSTTHREEGMQVILSAQLMPHYTFQTGRRGRLLVPFPQFPRFESAPQYHAGQALLQMLIIEEFMEQSLEFASEGSIRIAAERLDVFFQQSNLPRSVCDLVRAQWQRECSDGFLLQVSQDRFTLQTSYAKEMNFLRAQGQLRKERQRQGKNSVKKRRVVRLPTFN